MLSKLGISRSDLFSYLILALTALIFYLFYVGCDILYRHDSDEYLYLAHRLSWKYFFSVSENGRFPLIYPLFVKFYSLLLEKSILDSTIIVNIGMLQVFAFLVFNYMKKLGMSRVEALLGVLALFSNHTLIVDGFAGLYAEVLYFPLLILFVNRLIEKDFSAGKWFYLMFGGLTLIRYMHLSCLPLVMLGNDKLKSKLTNGIFFMLPFLLNTLKLKLLGRNSRHLSDTISININLDSNFDSLKNVFGLSLLPNALILLLFILFVILIWRYRHLIRSKIYYFSGLMLLSLSSVVLLTNIIFEHSVSFKERLLLNFVIILLPVVISFLCRVSFGRKIAVVGLSFFIVLNVYSFLIQSDQIARYRVSNIEATFPSFLKKLPEGTLLASNQGALLKELYGINGHNAFLKEKVLVPLKLDADDMSLFPDKVEMIVFLVNREREEVDVNAFFGNLGECDVRSNYQFEVKFFDIYYEYGVATKMKELPRSCYEKM